MKVHPAADLFPMLDESSLTELANSIRANGLRDPLVVHEGELVDGRNRLAACEIAGVEPTFVDYSGSPDDLIDWIIDKNVHRRHLTTSQRAMVASRLAQLPNHRPSEVRKSAHLPTQSEAASKLKVGRRTVQQARQVLESGNTELIARVDNGEVAVSAAAKQIRPTPAKPDAGNEPPPPSAPMPVHEDRCPARGTPHECADCPEGRGHHWGWLQGSAEPEPLLTCIHCHETIWDGPLPPGAPPRPDLEADPDAPRSAALQLQYPHGATSSDAPPAGDEPRELEPPPTSDLQGRAPLDAYWTPDAVAEACVRFLDERDLLRGDRVLEPCVGGGAWVRAAKRAWPEAGVFGVDVDPHAPGLDDADDPDVDDFFSLYEERYDLVLGNPPYASDLILPWLERSLKMAPVVAYVLPMAILGTQTRPTWWSEHPPAFLRMLLPRPRWEGQGRHSIADRSDFALVVWVSGHTGSADWSWIDVAAHRG